MEELAYLHEFCSDGSDFSFVVRDNDYGSYSSFVVRDNDCFLVSMESEEYEVGWSRHMLKFVSALGDLDAFSPRFVPAAKTLPQRWSLALVEVNMSTIEKALSFRKQHWRFLVDPFGPAAKAVYGGVPLNRPEDLLMRQPSHRPEDLSAR